MKKCDRCAKPAVYHITELRDGEAQALHFCEQCAKQHLSHPEVPEGIDSGSGEKVSAEEQDKLAEVDQQVAKGLPYVYRGVIPDEYWMGTDQLARVIDYGVRLVGEDHVALGSDFDGGPPLPRQIHDVSDYPEMTKALQQLGYSEDRIRKILGLNWLRVIRQVTEHPSR